MKRTFNRQRHLLDLGGYGDPRDTVKINDSFMNTLIIGGTGTGKSSSSGAMLANALLNPHNVPPEEKVGMVIYVYKSSDAEDWMRWVYQQGRQDDLIRIGPEHQNVYNLLSPYQDQEPINAVNALMNLSRVISGQEQKGSESFWDNHLRKGLDRLIRLNQLTGEDLNIHTLYEMHLSAPQNPEQAGSESFAEQSYLAQMMEIAAENVGEDHRDFQLIVKYFYQEMIYLDDRPASTIRSMVGGLLDMFISSEILSNLFCGRSDLDLNVLFQGKILLMDIPVQRYETVGKISQCALAYAVMKEIEKRDLDTYSNPIIFWVDECQNFLTPFTNLFMSVSRSSRAGHVLMTQNIANIMAVLGSGRDGEAKVNALLGLCNLIIIHANNCHLTNEWGARKIGKGFRHLGGASVDNEFKSSASTNMQLHHLVEPREFTMLRTGGEENDYLADAIILGTGRVFSNGQNYIQATFKQHFAP